MKKCRGYHCVKFVRIRSFCVQHFPAFELNKLFSVVIPNVGKYGPEKLFMQCIFKGSVEGISCIYAETTLTSHVKLKIC